MRVLCYSEHVLPQQRQTIILERLRDDHAVSVSALAREFSVSASTIRRDLNLMDSEGVLRRVRGGGTVEIDLTPYQTVASIGSKERMAIGKIAAELVSDRDVVLIDIGATAAMVARELKDRPVTVVTASLAVIDELRDSTVTEVISLGGVLRPSYLSFVGPLTQGALSNLRADIAFLGTSGINDDLMIMDTTGTEVPIKHSIIRSARRNVLVACQDKFPGSGLLPVCKISEMDVLVTTASSELKVLQEISASNVEVLTA